MTTVERLYDEVLALSDREREALLTRLELARIGVSVDVLEAWDKEAAEAEAEVAAGAATVPWSVVRAKMRGRIEASQG